VLGEALTGDASMQKSAACAFFDAVSETLSRVAAAALSLSAAAVHWRYLPHTLAAILLLGIGFPVWRSYCRWRRGWLSEMVKVEIRNVARITPRLLPQLVSRSSCVNGLFLPPSVVANSQ
jgi:hypothetical protein